MWICDVIRMRVMCSVYSSVAKSTDVGTEI